MYKIKENKIKTFFMDINLPIKNIENFNDKITMNKHGKFYYSLEKNP
tara:strand:- start:248 stop:388 length:141 start_codon:yes stop_codon:yes gene_type:complete